MTSPGSDHPLPRAISTHQARLEAAERRLIRTEDSTFSGSPGGEQLLVELIHPVVPHRSIGEEPSARPFDLLRSWLIPRGLTFLEHNRGPVVRPGQVRLITEEIHPLELDRQTTFIFMDVAYETPLHQAMDALLLNSEAYLLLRVRAAGELPVTAHQHLRQRTLVQFVRFRAHTTDEEVLRLTHLLRRLSRRDSYSTRSRSPRRP